ncbi:MAG TPA: glucose-1-phosphate adenylyltransferase [Vicinamibacterales bacterium]|nr:glucose-1-phosphate adenylyltransferase [Vicinamibacterales bacterium]
MQDVLTLILGGGRGTRLFPLTHHRSKPAVPIGGKYRLIDIPISLCLHAGLKRIFVLTQFNSASLNRHIAQTYRLDVFSGGFVEIIAAEQTPDSTDWFQGTADAVRQAARHFQDYDAQYFLILAGDHIYRMDFHELIDAHIESNADITIAAQPVTPEDATGMGIFHFDTAGRITAFEEKPNAARLREIGRSVPPGSAFGGSGTDKPFMASMGIYVFSRDVLLDLLRTTPGIDFGKELIPAALGTHRVHAYFYRGFWADVGTVRAFYDANLALTERPAPFRFFDPERPIYTRPRFLPGTRVHGCRIDRSIVAEGCDLEACTIDQSIIGIRMSIREGARIRRSVLLGADAYETPGAHTVPIGIGRNAVLDGVIVDKNARIADGVRLVNDAGVDEADGDGYYIRSGVIVVPKGAVVTAGM